MSEPEEGKFDDNLFEILKDCKSLPLFLDVVFGFLKRRTDFYVVAEDKSSPVGLPCNVAESMARHHFLKWKNQKDLPTTEQIKPTASTVKTTSKKSTITSVTPQKNTLDSYNGAVHDNYSWSQTINEIDVVVLLPTDLTAKQLDVKIDSGHISVKCKRSDETLLCGDLAHKVKHQDALWSLDKRKLEIHLEKNGELWWDRLLSHEDPLDISKLDCSRPFEDLSEEAKAKIEELQWNQERKRLGLLTSDQVDVQNKLKKAWDVEGTPFSGPFNPDSVVIN